MPVSKFLLLPILRYPRSWKDQVEPFWEVWSICQPHCGPHVCTHSRPRIPPTQRRFHWNLVVVNVMSPHMLPPITPLPIIHQRSPRFIHKWRHTLYRLQVSNQEVSPNRSLRVVSPSDSNYTRLWWWILQIERKPDTVLGWTQAMLVDLQTMVETMVYYWGVQHSSHSMNEASWKFTGAFDQGWTFLYSLNLSFFLIAALPRKCG